jgi:hypothetical protein
VTRPRARNLFGCYESLKRLCCVKCLYDLRRDLYFTEQVELVNYEKRLGTVIFGAQLVGRVKR